MARSPDYLRLATNAARSLADTAFDSLPQAALVIDSRTNRLPIVLANAAARGCLAGHSEQEPLLDGSLYGLLEPASASAIEPIFASLSDGQSNTHRALTWRLMRGECAVMTEFKLLDSAPGQRLVMSTFAPLEAEPHLVHAVEQLPFNLVLLDRQLNVTYANPGAERASGRTGRLLGTSALTLAPISAVPHEVYLRALEGCHYHEDGLELSMPGTPLRCFEIDMEPLKGASGIVGLIVLSTETGERPLPAEPAESTRTPAAGAGRGQCTGHHYRRRPGRGTAVCQRRRERRARIHTGRAAFDPSVRPCARRRCGIAAREISAADDVANRRFSNQHVFAVKERNYRG